MHALGPLLLALQAAVAPPVLEFPEPGLDDPVAYRGYHTRIFRDARGNALQIVLDGRSGRVVAVWADAANQSLGFTVRDSAGNPVTPTWGPRAAEVGEAGETRAVTVRLLLPPRPLVIGHFALGSMRWERDLQYAGRHVAPFDSTLPPVPEVADLVRRLGRLDSPERELHLALLAAHDVEALRARLEPTLALAENDSVWTLRIDQPTLDGRNRLALELRGSARDCAVEVARKRMTIRPRGAAAWTLAVRVETDAASLAALDRQRIFNPEFFDFLERARREDSTGSRSPRLERQVRGAEILSYEEKLMAGLPNFATYFGRDMMMTALMMDPVWSPAMLEHVVGSVLRKVSEGGEVSHEEALGGQAIREHAAEYTALLAAAGAVPARRDSLLARARGVLGDLQAVRENYHMLDDDFQLPVVAARYLAQPGIADDEKRRFLLAPARAGRMRTRLEALMRNFRYVAARSAPYAASPRPSNLVGFQARGRGEAGYRPASWRDSGAGYAGGRFAMDINVIWVPEALRAIAASLDALRALGLPADSLARGAPGAAGRATAALLDPGSLARARARWAGAARHFEVRIGPAERRQRLARWLAWLPDSERVHWRAVADSVRPPGDTLRFLALALDRAGRPIPVVNTDPATWLALADLEPARALDLVRPILLPYPVGLFVPGLGPLVANDAYATPAVWEAFRRDHYHSPRVVWGREVNLLLLGLARQVRAAADGDTLVPALRAALEQTRAAVEAAGLEHAELWTYELRGDGPRPVRYGSSTDVQLWNLTDLAVEFTLARLGPGNVRRAPRRRPLVRCGRRSRRRTSGADRRGSGARDHPARAWAR